MAATTALAYQMMIEEKMLSAMINAEQRGHFAIAAQYALIHANFIGCEDLPAKPLGAKTNDEVYAQHMKYYFDLLGIIGGRAKQVLIDVRVKYGKKDSTIPKVHI